MKNILQLGFITLLTLSLTPLRAMAESSLPLLPANIGPTTTGASSAPIDVVGQPRVTKGHPCTVWDQEDILHFREMLKTSKELQAQLAELKAAMDARIAEPLNVPPPQKGVFPGEYFPAYPETPNDDAGARWRRRIMRNSNEISDLATVYALTGEAKYAEYSKALLLSYACFSQHGQSKGYTLRSCSGMVTQLLEEALLLSRWARAYDLIYNLPSWKPEERARIHDELFQPFAYCQLYPAAVDINPKTGGAFATQVNNRGAIGSVSVLMAGYATDDQDLINAALYGITPTQKAPPKEANTVFPPPKHWTACTAAKPNGGLIATHFGECIPPDGVWIEGSPSYAFYALGSLIAAAETLWHHGIDMYRYRNGALKGLFDFPMLLAYPDMTLPALNDAHREHLVGGNMPVLYEYAYRRYRDPAYLPIIKSKITTYSELGKFIGGTTGQWGVVKKPEDGTTDLPEPKSSKTLHVSYVGGAPTSVLYDLDPNEKEVPFVQNSANFFSVGYGILRTPGASGVNNLLLTFGPSASHGHPDKLMIDIFAFNDVLMPTPGIIFPYNNPLDKTWFHTTLAHGTLTVDEKSQMYFGEMYKYPKGTPNPHADQLVYGAAATMGIQRAWTDTCYTGVTMDRSLFLTRNYVADLFSALSSTPHKYDLAWHIRGELTSDLKLDPMAFQSPPDGYSVLQNVRHAQADKAWSVTLKRENHVARLLGAPTAGTEVIVGDNGRYDDSTVDRSKLDHPPTIIVRRDKAPATVFGAVMDLSDSKEGYVKSVTQEGTLTSGYALLKVDTVKGTDYCFASYRPGNYRAGAIETDAQQALVVMDGQNLQSMYLGGGRSLKVGALVLQRGEPGLAYIEKTDEGGYIVANPSPTATMLTVMLPNLANFDAFTIDGKGKRAGAAALLKGVPNAFAVKLNATSKIELVPKK